MRQIPRGRIFVRKLVSGKANIRISDTYPEKYFIWKHFWTSFVRKSQYPENVDIRKFYEKDKRQVQVTIEGARFLDFVKPNLTKPNLTLPNLVRLDQPNRRRQPPAPACWVIRGLPPNAPVLSVYFW